MEDVLKSNSSSGRLSALSLLVFVMIFSVQAMATSTLIDFGHLLAPLSGVTLLVHGLNTNPQKMLSLAKELNQDGQVVVLVSLTGHHGDSAAFGHVTPDIWLNDLEEGFHQAEAAASQYRLPLNFVGYSLGAAVGIDLIIQRHVHFDRMILLAPALQLRKTSGFVRALDILGPQFVVPSFSPKEYRANSGTTMAAYDSLFSIGRRIRRAGAANFHQANVPTLILIDPADELVSPVGLHQFVEQHHLSKWKIQDVSNNEATVRPKYHHLIIDQASLGSREWLRVKGLIRSHLKPASDR
jgi:esterase/lipase